MMIDTGSPLRSPRLRSSTRSARPRAARRVGVGPGCGGRCRSGPGWGCRTCTARGRRGCTCRGRRIWRRSPPRVAHASGVSSPRIGMVIGAALWSFGQSAGAGAFGVVGCGAVLIEQEQPQRGGVLEFLGADADRDAHQVDFDLLAGGGVDPARQGLEACRACTLTCSALISPAAWAAATAGSIGGSGWPVKAWRGPQVAGGVEAAVGFAGDEAPPGRQDVFPGFGAQSSAGWSRPATGPERGGTGWAAGRSGFRVRRGTPAAPARAGLRGRRRLPRRRRPARPSSLRGEPSRTCFEHTFDHRQKPAALTRPKCARTGDSLPH